jgi:hypothetical protein
VSPLYRTFTVWPDRADPLAVARGYQGGGRHDNPDVYGALYASRSPVSAVAESLRRFRGRPVGGRPFERADGGRLALATVDDSGLEALVDLDDPADLDARSLRPSSVATHDRERTQPIALSIYREGAEGFAWWSAVEASWINLTLFAERAVPKLAVVGDPEMLDPGHPAVRSAAEAVGVRLDG